MGPHHDDLVGFRRTGLHGFDILDPIAVYIIGVSHRLIAEFFEDFRDVARGGLQGRVVLQIAFANGARQGVDVPVQPASQLGLGRTEGWQRTAVGVARHVDTHHDHASQQDAQTREQEPSGAPPTAMPSAISLRHGCPFHHARNADLTQERERLQPNMAFRRVVGVGPAWRFRSLMVGLYSDTQTG
jgi:hypothetical protein